ncbi:MAG: Omp85 family outer membrane protein [Myxococcaceae bacterium]
MLLPLLVWSLTFGQAEGAGTSGAPPDTPSIELKKDSGIDGLGVPLISFNSDQGFGFGAVGGAYFYAKDYRPYRHALGAQIFFTTRGVQNHWLRWDAPNLIGKLRFEARAEWRHEKFAPYFGPGNISVPDFDGNLMDPRYNYDRFAPGGFVRLRGPSLIPGVPLSIYGGYAFKYTKVTPYPGSLLEQEKPLGFAGGPTGQVQAGILFDTRDDESDPSTGGIEEIAVRGSAEPTGSKYRFGGVTVSERRFFRLFNKERYIFAQRLTADFQFGDVPFFEWPNTGGLNGTEAIGGMSSIRGVPRQRFAGQVKVISNTEIRFYVWDFPLFGAPVKLGGLVFADVGRVWQPKINDGGLGAWHAGFGGGLRVARRAAVLRADLAYAPEIQRSAVYLTFGHLF